MQTILAEFFIGQSDVMQRTFTQEDVTLYITLTGDNNPVFTNQELIEKTKFGRPFVPGILTEGLVSEVITKKLPGTPAAVLQKELIFHHPVFVGDSVTAELQIIDIDYKRRWITEKITCYNQDGKEVVTGQVLIFVLTEE
ncbi:enoyl-CoA hydratase [Brevibacillus fluminis]|uniref:Enoyl-CoA hydratase n=1 Tax=Brevibacillus fluminis TaxID=511487 RepID=A0A3M8DHX8_9BACL|nr:MaoC/PaaZ C-terminal domain-containing protein [Brevibacillus fluminis]RNB87644.1 enoyl-CoA hydratase [Brevibacillus fluminis]